MLIQDPGAFQKRGKNDMKILVIRFSSIGDIVLTTPVVRCLKEQISGLELHYLTKFKYKGVLQHNPHIDKIHVYSKKYKSLINQLRYENFDQIIDLHNNQRTFLFKMALGVKSMAVDKINLQKWLMVKFKKDRLPKLHMVDRYMETVKHLGVVNDNKGLDHYIHERDHVDLPTYFPQMSNSEDYIAFAIGGQHFTKRLPLYKISSICKRLPLPVILLGGLEDELVGDSVVSEAIRHNKILNGCGKLRLNQSASVVQQAKWVISHDTGMMHIATAYGKDLISIWGNTIPEFGMSPYPKDEKQKRKIVEVKGLNCRPCSKIGYSACPQGHFKCLNDIQEDLVIQNLT